MESIQTLRTQYRVSDFVAWQRDDALELNPNFQRRPVWKKGAKSYLIDTILRGLPMPIIFLRDLRSDLRTLKAKRDVVDGQQRIRTIFSYVDPTLLRDYVPNRDDFTISRVHNTEHAGKAFGDLKPAVKQRILDYQFSVHSFAADTDDRELLQIFARMNSTGVKANWQELRNAEFFGEFKQICYELATEQLNRWRNWGIFSPDKIARMMEVELTSELVILALNGITGKTKQQIDKFYSAYESKFPSATEAAARIRDVFETIGATYSTDDISRFFSSITMFYELFATLYGLKYNLRVPVKRTKDLPPDLEKIRPQLIERNVTTRILDAAKSIHFGKELPSL